jgi:hypothetical protein
MTNRYNNNLVTIQIASGFLDDVEIALRYIQSRKGAVAFTQSHGKMSESEMDNLYSSIEYFLRLVSEAESKSV